MDINVPTFFVCPISLEIMKDPVTLSSGVTYDRDSIEKWLFSGKHTTCPVTKQVISGDYLTPNHTLRRLIQSWCTLNSVDRIPTPKPPVTKPQVVKLLLTASDTCLRSLRALASENATNKRCIEASGAVDFLASMIIVNDGNTPDSLIGEALTTLHSLRISDSGLKSLLGSDGGAFLHALTRVMRSAGSESRSHAVLVLKPLLHVAEPCQLSALRSDFFGGVVGVIRDRISRRVTKAALQVLVGACGWGRNRVKAVEAGGTAAMVEVLLEHSSERRMNEMALVVLDFLCGCAEGRAELVEHAAGLAVVGKKILRVSAEGSERAVRILVSVSKYSGSGRVVEEMVAVGVAAKLCLVLQAECGSKTKEKAKEILKSHARAWRNSPCIPSHLQTSYPA